MPYPSNILDHHIILPYRTPPDLPPPALPCIPWPQDLPAAGAAPAAAAAAALAPSLHPALLPPGGACAPRCGVQAYPLQSVPDLGPPASAAAAGEVEVQNTIASFLEIPQ
jgi:hypothetical protein